MDKVTKEKIEALEKRIKKLEETIKWLKWVAQREEAIGKPITKEPHIPIVEG